jgi:hypothetical protein
MAHSDNNPPIDQNAKEKMLDDLESLSRMLDEEEDDTDTPARPLPNDIPVLKSFVDDVPVLQEAFEEPPTDSNDSGLVANLGTTKPITNIPELPVSSETAAPPVGKGANLDMSFLDKDPLDISDRVRDYRSQGTQPASSAPAAEAPVPHSPPAQAQPTAHPPGSGHNHIPAHRFQESGASENPFLPRSTLEKIRKNHAWNQNQDSAEDASAQLRKLLQDNPLNKINFDPNSREAQILRQKASQMVDEVVRTNLHRLEAELRMKLEQEVDRMFKEAKKNPR